MYLFTLLLNVIWATHPSPNKGTTLTQKDKKMKLIKTDDMARYKLNICVHGEAGTGKTRLAATTGDIDKTLIVSAEGGLLSLRDAPATATEVKTREDISAVYRWLTESDEGKGMTWVCVDSLSEIAEIVLQTELERNRDPRKAYGELGQVMTKMIRSFRDLDKHVYMSCKTERLQSETGSLLWAPSMPGNKLGQSVPFFFDEIFCLRTVTGEDGSIVRFLQTQPDGSFTAKDRSGALEFSEEPNLLNIKNKILGDK